MGEGVRGASSSHRMPVRERSMRTIGGAAVPSHGSSFAGRQGISPGREPQISSMAGGTGEDALWGR